MKLSIYLSIDQARDFVRVISVGDRLTVELLANPGSTLGPEVPSLPIFLTSSASKQLKRTGIVEYAFCGLIQDVQSLENHGGPDLTYREILVDCGVPLIVGMHSHAGFVPFDVDNPTAPKIAAGRYIGGLCFIHGRIAFRYPTLISRELNVRVTSLSKIHVLPNEEEIGGRGEQLDSIDSKAISEPIALEVETEEKPG